MPKAATAQAVIEALRATGWNRRKSARLLGVNVITVTRRIKEMGATLPKDSEACRRDFYKSKGVSVGARSPRELKPGEATACPFCGEHELKLCGGTGDFYIQCTVCTTTGPNGADEESCFVQWNHGVSRVRH